MEASARVSALSLCLNDGDVVHRALKPGPVPARPPFPDMVPWDAPVSCACPRMTGAIPALYLGEYPRMGIAWRVCKTSLTPP
jgi:hypothetical protein